MAITYSDRFFATGGHASVTFASASGDDITVTGDTPDSSWLQRSIWFYQHDTRETRNIVGVSGNTITLERPFTSTPSGSGIVSFIENDFNAVNSTQWAQTEGSEGSSNDPMKGAAWEVSSRVVVGNDSTWSFVKWRNSSIVFTHDPSGQGSNSTIRVRGRAILQLGDLDSSDIPYNDGELRFSRIGRFDRHNIHIDDEADAALKVYGYKIGGLFAYDAGSPDDVFVIEYSEDQSLSYGEWVGANFSSPSQLRVFTDQFKARNCLFKGVFVLGGLYEQFDNNKFQVFGKGLEASFFTPSGTFDITNSTFLVGAVTKNSQQSNNFATGSVSFKRRSGFTRILRLIDTLWSQPFYQENPNDALIDSSILNLVSLAISTLEGSTPVDGFKVTAQAISGDIRQSGWNLETGSTDAAGVASLQVHTHVFDERSRDGTKGATYPDAPVPAEESLLWRIRGAKYGYQPFEGSQNLANPNTDFYTLVNVPLPQAAATDDNISQLPGTAAAHNVTLTDHGATPVTWQGLQWGLTVQAGAGVSAADVYHWLAYQRTQASFNGQDGLYWHNLMPQPDRTQRGSYYDTSTQTTTLKGVRVIDQAGEPLAGVVQMVSDSGSPYIPPVQYAISFTGLPAGTKARAHQGSQTLLVETGIIDGNFAYSYTYQANEVVDFTFVNPQFRTIALSLTLQPSNQTTQLEFEPDPSYIA